MNKVTIPTSFPNLPASIAKIQLLYSQNDINTKKLTKLLEEEPMLCANILKLVNSPYYGLNNRIISISQAVTLLGTTIIRGILMAVVLKKSFPLDLSPYNISLEQFDKISTLRVKFINLWLKNENIDLQSLSSLAFLMECGKIVMANAILKNNLSQEFKMISSNLNVIEAEKKLFDTNSYNIASILFKQWLFNDEFTNTLKNIIEPKSIEEKILSILLNIINTESILDEQNIQDSYELVKKYHLNAELFKKSIEIITKEL